MSRSAIQWFRDVSIKRKLYFVMGIMALLIAVELVTLVFTIRTLSSTRAYVGGEGLWSKAQKDAVYSLKQYADSGNEEHYEQFLSFLKVPLGDRKARTELEKPDPDLKLVYEGFIEGRNHPEDIGGMIKLFRRFRHIEYIDRAVTIWARADSEIVKLNAEAEKLHRLILSKQGTAEQVKIAVENIDLLNLKLTVLEDEFSYTLGEGSRWLESLILTLLFLVALTVELSGLFLTISVSITISKGINEIVRVAGKVSKGDLSGRAKLFSGDEIGKLADSFNNMVDELQKKITELQTAEENLRKQKDLYETLVNAQGEMGEGVSITEGPQIVFVNAAFCKMYGYTMEEVLTSGSFEKVIESGERERLSNRITAIINAGGMSDTGETIATRKDGTVIYIEYALYVIRRENKIQVVSIVRDITDRKKAESKFRGLLESAPDAMIIANNEGIIQLVNAQTEKLFLFRREDIIGQDVGLLIPDTNGSGGQIFQQPGIMEMRVELSGQRKDGTVFPAEISISPLETEDGILVLAAIRDITEKKNAAKSLQDYATRLERSNKELEQFAYVASHDLREPLRTITSFVQLLQARYQDKLGKEANEFIEFTVGGANRMNRLIGDLLTYSRVGKQEQQMEQLDCNKIIATVIAQLRETINEKNAEITFDTLPEIKANELMMIQLLQNLVSNAIKFHGDAPPKVHISAKKQKQEWVFSVKDEGIGIDKKFSERIFVIFQRLHPGNTYEGTGIGLAICKKIVDRHGGKIWFDSEPGKGTVFYFTIKDVG